MSFNMETDSDSSFSSAGSPCNNFNHCCLDFEDDPYRFKNIYLFELCFLGCVCRDDPKGECSWTSEIMQKETELEEVSHKYIFFTMYQFFTQPLGILCPITFNQNICKYVKIHKNVCKCKQNLVEYV